MNKNLNVAKQAAQFALDLCEDHTDELRDLKTMDEYLKDNIAYFCGLAYLNAVHADAVFVGVPADTAPTDYEHRAEGKTVYVTKFDLHSEKDKTWFMQGLALDRNQDEELVIRYKPDEGERRGIRDLRGMRFMDLDGFEAIAELDRAIKGEEKKNRGKTFERLVAERWNAERYPDDVWYKVPDIKLFGDEIQVKYLYATVLKVKQLRDLVTYIGR